MIGTKEYYYGCALILVLLKQSTQELGCRIFEDNKYLSADCKEKGLYEVPQNLDPKIKVLDLSRNNFIKLNESSFFRYPYLRNLVMTALHLNFHPEFNLFRSLKLLEKLDLSFSIFGNKSVHFYWPPSLKELNLSYMDFMHAVDVSNLSKLEKLDLKNSSVLKFPIFESNAPVSFINLNHSLMPSMRPEDLAPLCKVKRLIISFNPASMILTASRFCECSRLNTWIKKCNIETSPKNLKCHGFQNECDLNFTEEAYSLRQKCLSNNRRSILLHLAIGLTILLVMMLASMYGYIRKRKEDDLQ